MNDEMKNTKNMTDEILELPKLVADKIAAGEVVERPLSIVKELVENAIDSGAKAITVEIKNGGKRYIRVTDNGCGIRKEQVELAFKRHATSKIRSSDDLTHIKSLGFRGEALSSIAAVSKVELISKTIDEKTGVSLKIEGGIIAENVEIGCPEGTSIIVSELFFNTPAREKFLKADHTESTMIIDFISKMALAYPQIKMRIINNGNILFSTNGKNDVYTNILTVYSKETGNNLLHFTDKNDDDFLLEGLISPPQNTKTNRKGQIFFVNGRYIQNKILDNAVSTAYSEKIFDGRYPTAFLFLRIPAEMLDVNIHPNKKEVKFAEEERVKEFVVNAIRDNLNKKEAITEIKTENIFKLNTKDVTIPVKKSKEQANQREEQVDVIKLRSTYSENINKKFVDIPMVREEKASYFPNATIKKPFDIREINILSNIFSTYIIGADYDSLYLIDQHAAHERILYEELLSLHEKSEKNQQTILLPIIKEVSYAIKSNIENWLYFLRNIGFDIEEFGVKSYVIKGIPMFMGILEAELFLDDFIDTVDENTDFTDNKKSEKIISKACKNAVKANDKLDKKEMEEMLIQLSNCKNPYSCPHGRPVFVRMTKYEIEKMFKRV